MKLKIAVIGAGAMGCLYGAYLARNRENVWLNDVWEKHITRINSRGLSVVSPDESFVAHPKATSIVMEIGKADLIIICLKTQFTAEGAVVAETLAHSDSVILTLQNGLGNAEQLAETLGPERILVGESAMGAILLEPGHIMHGGLKTTHIGSFSGNNKRVQEIAAIFNRSGLPTEVTPNVASLLWSKVVIHAGINAVTAITKATNGELLETPDALRLAELAVVEAQSVAKALGIPLVYDDPIQQMRDFASAMRGHQSSMLQDVKHKRHTEIDAINGMIVQEGRRIGVPTPVNESLTLMLRTIEQLGYR